MRERWAKLFAAALVLWITGLAALFAERQNAARPTARAETSGAPATPRVPPAQGPQDAEAVARGRQSFVTLGCLRCHRVAGEGSPRSVLDDVGARLFPDEIRAWIVANPPIASRLSGSAAQAKSEYRSIPEEALGDLVSYLSSLRGGG